MFGDSLDAAGDAFLLPLAQGFEFPQHQLQNLADLGRIELLVFEQRSVQRHPPLKKNPASGAIWLKFSTRPCTCGAIFIRYSGFNAHFCTSRANSSTDCSRIHCPFSQESFSRSKIGPPRETRDRSKCSIISARVNFSRSSGIDQPIRPR